MELLLNHYKEKIKVHNPKATLAVVSLWDDPFKCGLELNHYDAPFSKVACIGALRGKGFRYLVRTLLENPQIKHVVVVGEDDGGARYYLSNFVAGISTNTMDKLLDAGVREAKLDIEVLNCANHERAAEVIAEFGKRDNDCQEPRVIIPVPEYKPSTFPSNPNGHFIYADTVEEAHNRVKWEIGRFGVDVDLMKGKRRELRNLMVEIQRPMVNPEFHGYQMDMQNPVKGQKPYTYGFRLRGEYDALLACKESLASNELDDRNCHMSTWLNFRDIMGNHRPCMLGVTFRKQDGILYCHANFRSHNAMDAWHMNAHGLIGYMEFVRGDLKLGPLTIISHSISIDPAGIVEIPEMYCEERRDPNGIFTFSIDGGQIEATHWDHDGNVLTIYKGRKASGVGYRIARDKAATEPSHLIYIGRQLERCEAAIAHGERYIER